MNESSASSSSSSSTSFSKPSEEERFYSANDSKLTEVRQKMEWMKDPKYFKSVKISPSATIKMMAHGQSGVEKGTKKSGKPIEVMGLLVGRPDTEDQHCLIISDAQPLPIEGFETRVIADDESTVNYMIELGEMNELTKKERFCGWYHTHPFDVDVNSNCYLSNTDISTQLMWQRSEDPHGNPWFALVIDPLRSLAKSKPEIKAFRVYPPEYSAPQNETPDGTIVTDDRKRVEKWGACWNRYYELEVSYFMSSLSQRALRALKHEILWQQPFSSTPFLEPDQQGREAEHIQAAASKARSGQHRLPSQHVLGLGDIPTDTRADRDDASVCVEVSVDHSKCCTLQLVKLALFCNQRSAKRAAAVISSEASIAPTVLKGTADMEI